MKLLTGPEFNDLFHRFRNSAWRLETRPAYKVPEEQEPLRRFLAGEEPDDAYAEAWLKAVRTATDAGRHYERVRVLSEPLTDYLRFSMDFARRRNAPAGEDIRVLQPALARELNLPDIDFWLFDDNTVAQLHIRDDNTVDGAEIITGDAVQKFRHWKHVAWSHATPLTEWAG